MSQRIRAAIESTPKRSFATAVDWPGWSRSGRSVALALDNLAAYALRYAAVARAAGEPFAGDPGGPGAFEVVEQAEGGGGTEFTSQAGSPTPIGASPHPPTPSVFAASWPAPG